MGDLSKNFSRREFACKCGCGYDDISPRVVEALQKIRDRFGRPVKVHSGCRCQKHNRSLKAASPYSRHLIGLAADISIEGVTPPELAKYAARVPLFKGGGIGLYDWGVHLDGRGGGPARWDLRTKKKK